MPSVFLDQSGEVYQPQQGHILTGFQFNATSFFFFSFLVFLPASSKNIWL